MRLLYPPEARPVVGYLKPTRLMIQAGKSGGRTMAPRSR